MSKEDKLTEEEKQKYHDQGGQDASNNKHRKPFPSLICNKRQAQANDKYSEEWQNTHEQKKKK